MMVFKIVIFLLLLTTICSAKVKNKFIFGHNISSHHTNHVVKTIQSEDGDIIECINIHKQPAFKHPALRNHKIQMTPSYYHQTTEQPKKTSNTKQVKENHNPLTTTTQIWHKTGSCPRGTIPVRMARNTRNGAEITKKSNKGLNNDGKLYLLHRNHSLAMLHTEGFSYLGAKGDIKICNPHVELDDEYSTSQVTLSSGPYYAYEEVQSGWAVNPSVYGDRQTRYFTYWTVDGSNKTGCFDLTCPGFVQTSHEIALGAAIYPISSPNGLPYQITVYIHQDPYTGNWWVQYGDRINIGYWPPELFKDLQQHANTVQWGGEVYSRNLGEHRPHTSTAMGSGYFADFIFGRSGYVKRMRILGNSMELMPPDWAYPYTDEYRCYDTFYLSDYIEDPEFYFGGPGRNQLCP